MFKWWKRNKSKPIPMSILNDDNKKKKSRSFVSFSIDNHTNDSQEIIEKSSVDLRQPNFKLYNYFQYFDELINDNSSCFGFSLSEISSKYCLYITIIIFLSICFIIALTAVFKN